MRSAENNVYQSAFNQLSIPFPDPAYVSPIRYGYFGKDTPEVVRLMFCNISGCLTDGKIFMSVSGEAMVSVNTRDTTGLRMLQEEQVEVGFFQLSEQNYVNWPILWNVAHKTALCLASPGHTVDHRERPH